MALSSPFTTGIVTQRNLGDNSTKHRGLCLRWDARRTFRRLQPVVARCIFSRQRMHLAADAMKTALRVLNALASQCEPDGQDVDELRRLAPLLADSPLEELAWDVIRQAMKRHDATGAVEPSHPTPGGVEWIS